MAVLNRLGLEKDVGIIQGEELKIVKNIVEKKIDFFFQTCYFFSEKKIKMKKLVNSLFIAENCNACFWTSPSSPPPPSPVSLEFIELVPS